MIELHCQKCGKGVDISSGVRRCPYCGNKFEVKLNWPKDYEPKNSLEFFKDLSRKRKRKKNIKLICISFMCISCL